jgi:Activator of Hsp90 ATPase homolog 1-like protein
MTVCTISHDTFMIERTYDAPVERVYRAWTDPLIKAQWFAGSVDALQAGYELDFRVGGREFNRGGPPGATVEFRSLGATTQLVITEQGVYLDGHDNAAQREAGTHALLDALGAAVSEG